MKKGDISINFTGKWCLGGECVTNTKASSSSSSTKPGVCLPLLALFSIFVVVVVVVDVVVVVVIVVIYDQTLFKIRNYLLEILFPKGGSTSRALG